MRPNAASRRLAAVSGRSFPEASGVVIVTPVGKTSASATCDKFDNSQREDYSCNEPGPPV